jgi:hypothetical protein
MKLKHIILPLIIFAGFYLSACQKDFTVDINTPNIVDSTSNNDTSKILTIKEYHYSGGISSSTTDSSIGILRNATINGLKKITFTSKSFNTNNDTAFVSTFLYDNQNQLIEVKTTSNYFPAYYDKDIYTWSNGNLIKHQYDSSGTIKFTFDYFYTPNGLNTKISSVRTPSANVVALNGTYLSSGYSTLTVNQNFLPVSKQYFDYSYLENASGNIGHTSIIRDTTNVLLSLDALGNLTSKTATTTGTDSLVIVNTNFPPTLTFYKNITTTTYQRNTNDNQYFTNILKDLYGTKLFLLSNYYDNNLNISDIIFPDYFSSSNNIYCNQSLNKRTINMFSWINGIPNPNNGTATYDDFNAVHTFNNLGRLSSSTVLSLYSNNLYPRTGIKIIYP